MRGLCLLGQRAMTLCRGVLGLSDPTWYIRLPLVSEDKGGYRYPDRCAFRDHLGSLPVLRPTRGVGQHNTARRDPWWTGCNWASRHGIGTVLPHALRAATPFRAPAALFQPHVVPISEVISLWDPSAIRRSNSGKVYALCWFSFVTLAETGQDG
ncbi:hypothetical protein EDB84DRAFT_1435292 [Lactarius hengduanensis]|nr:hypothetical protein EDB84DRAFT_1435292 [Lactarius hengduanensis]